MLFSRLSILLSSTININLTKSKTCDERSSIEREISREMENSFRVYVPSKRNGSATIGGVTVLSSERLETRSFWPPLKSLFGNHKNKSNFCFSFQVPELWIDHPDQSDEYMKFIISQFTLCRKISALRGQIEDIRTQHTLKCTHSERESSLEGTGKSLSFAFVREKLFPLPSICRQQRERDRLRSMRGKNVPSYGEFSEEFSIVVTAFAGYESSRKTRVKKFTFEYPIHISFYNKNK